mmetsp:Transcript_39457/g.109608  ORF Transcript_39457/g.109608 Transcript_39457/m.109608 type:complete len:144 (+) Transcript_39457:38-469(+)
MVEVHIPKKGIYGRLEPLPALSDDDLPDELQLLRELEDHEVFAIGHLERSNQELQEVLRAEDDADFRLAVAENLEVLARKRAQLEKIREKIRMVAPNSVGRPGAAAAPRGFVPPGRRQGERGAEPRPGLGGLPEGDDDDGLAL